ncbi:hypothetical protein OOK60_00520 [Trichothermofontia sichuanensis B231]|nr:hypothetical protein [Trichothermofontia sichuanensis]UZQ54595.1 hypothetical protein OOK60_00520 [Trichothermofontia sichuanensis B231]
MTALVIYSYKVPQPWGRQPHQPNFLPFIHLLLKRSRHAMS